MTARTDQRPRRALALAALLLATGACAPGASGMLPQQPRSGPPPQPMAARVVDLDGQETTLGSLRGQVVLLDFWASWCSPCHKAFPYYADVYARHRSQGMTVAAVSIDQDFEAARAFALRWALPFAVFHDSFGEAAAAFSVSQIPTSFILDRLGRVRFIHRGFDPSRAGRLDEEVQFLLSE